MWRSFFLACGIFCCALGAELLVTERLVLAGEETPRATGFGARTARRDFTPPDWAPWSLLSSGSIVILYGLTLPKTQGSAPPAHA